MATLSAQPRIPATSVFFKSGAYTSLHPVTNIGVSNALTVNVLKVVPLVIAETTRIIRIGAEVTTIGDVGSTFVIMLFADVGGGSHYPGSLFFDASVSGSASSSLGNGLIDGHSATVQDVTCDLTFTPGVYWAGGVPQGVTVTMPTFRVPGSSSPSWSTALGTALPSAGATGYGFSQAAVSGAAPSSFTSTITAVASGTVVPRLHAKVA